MRCVARIRRALALSPMEQGTLDRRLKERLSPGSDRCPTWLGGVSPPTRRQAGTSARGRVSTKAAHGAAEIQPGPLSEHAIHPDEESHPGSRQATARRLVGPNAQVPCPTADWASHSLPRLVQARRLGKAARALCGRTISWPRLSKDRAPDLHGARLTHPEGYPNGSRRAFPPKCARAGVSIIRVQGSGI
jgi:hypothetical protein